MDIASDEKKIANFDEKVERKEPAAVARHILLSFSAGVSGAFGSILCAHVFANAETGNLIGFASDLTGGDWLGALGRLGGVVLFVLGILCTVRIPQRLFGGDILRWQKCCLLMEAACFALQAVLPYSILGEISPALYLWPVFFASAAQYNTFNLLEGVPVSTLFSTNNLRQMTLHWAVWRDSGNAAEFRIGRNYFLAVLAFTGGAFAEVYLIRAFGRASILVCSLVMLGNWVWLRRSAD